MSGDEHHAMAELYQYRMLYNAHAANAWARERTYPVVKSWKHSDGQDCFGGGWFIVVATLPTGQVSNHYAAEHWDAFDVPEVEQAPEWDGHTSEQAAERLAVALFLPVPSVLERQVQALSIPEDGDLQVLSDEDLASIGLQRVGA